MLLLAYAFISCATQKEPAIKDSFPYTIGAALSVDVFTGKNPMADSIVTRHYSSIVAENCMKSENIHPERDRFFWDEADRFVAYGEDHGMEIIGHCLVCTRSVLHGSVLTSAIALSARKNSPLACANISMLS